ncbi:MAG: pyridoxal 5'-phosphate synthase glutaminase subunit PdxT [Prevotella sp.]|nr:pyridoxal 5'-phosphate synthase glutaminase subunit PdxT [Prevotella sp.]MBP6528156.1 pyridoxal 5'-phosphate synthase glutaminase subunit PdxT [Prevotella sp.]MBP7097644.1 pyridoxal 5'-phosphate synthase glutaminase subunit PdxT [Prevotella sp.]MBP8686614.1 pyridoxal 5'-phosphate synthase glutaminase subunit PdxT [Prevotella sp.]MBP9982306.1 pyridoxal 5'-phosphate synthase glutaminase subunit PdxT [Prevotella sp.]MCI1731600.1 pyridoxal 5'-phosphate synthase glutaminase subunit PdxT [Prevote
MNIGVLALQGAFIEHERILNKIGVDCFEIRNLKDWSREKDGLIIPGGESTTQLKLLKELELLEPIKRDIESGLPVFGTCAGLILLAKKVENEDFERISTMDINVCRNAYGRQLGSFYAEDMFAGNKVQMTFIRAPYIKDVGKDVEVLSNVGNHIVAAKQKNQLVTSFHPELNESTFVHEYFINMVATNKL